MEVNRRIKEWEDKFDQEQKIKEENLIKKFYSDNSDQDLKSEIPEENNREEDKSK